MIYRLAASIGLLATAALTIPVVAQTDPAPDTLIVLDGSGSMWGQINGRTKIEIARETLSTVLSEISPGMNVGMIAYGHRVRGQCSDIETLVPIGPAGQTVPGMIDAANRINPRGMTPLSDAVRQAAEGMRYTERAATVVLITDGIETCNADPCALGNELSRAGIDFTAHVVGFGLSGDEGRQVACLAENTGGRYIAADDADQLVDALRRTIVADDSDFVDVEDDFVEEPILAPRRVEFTFRDATDTPKLDARHVQISIEPRAGVQYDAFRTWHHERDYTAEGVFEPGTYDVLVSREVDRARLTARFEIEVEPGPNTLVIDRAIGARLRINTLVHSGLMLGRGEGIAAANRSDIGYGIYDLVPVAGGVADESAKLTYGEKTDFDVAVPPGDYLVRGTFGRSFTREKLITVAPGENKVLDFDFELAKVTIDFRDAAGGVPDRPLTRVSDDPGGNSYFVQGRDALRNEPLPWYLPVGSWRLDTGPEGGGDKRAQLVVTVDRAGEEISLRARQGQRLSDSEVARMADESRKGCLGFGGTVHAANACIIEKVVFSSALPEDPDSVSIDGLPNPYTQNSDAMLLPPGIYGIVERAGFDPSSGTDIGEAVASCANRPFIAYPDGHIQVKAHSPMASAAGSPYRPMMAGQCTAQAGFADCQIWEVTAPGEKQPMQLEISVLAEGHFRAVNRSRQNSESTFYSCVRPGGEMSPTELLPDGIRAIDHVMQRSDGGPELAYSDTGEYLGPKVPEVIVSTETPQPGGDFRAIAGLYGRLSASGEHKQGHDLLDACYYNGLVLYPDGFAQGYRENTGADAPAGTSVPPIPAMHMMCSGNVESATCTASLGGYPGGTPLPDKVGLSAKAQDVIEICVSGDCFRMQQCRDPRVAFADDDPAPDGRHWLDHVLPRPDGGQGLEPGQ